MNLSLLVLPVVLLISVALAVASAWGLYWLTKQRWVWALTPVFAVFWLAVGAMPLGVVFYAFYARAAAPVRPPVAPAPAVPAPVAPVPDAVDEARGNVL